MRLKTIRQACNDALLRGIMPNLHSLDGRLDELLHSTYQPLPESLCHYTNESGLRGILGNRQIWAVDFRRQGTDALEFQHADAIILQVAAELAGNASKRAAVALNDFVRRYEREKLSVLAGHDTFIACFCRQWDNPTLWNDFAAKGTGFAIEFNVFEDPKGDLRIGTSFWPVEYDSSRVANTARREFARVLHTLDMAPGANVGELESSARLAVGALFRHAALIASCHKSQKYARDEETRLVCLRAIGSDYPVHEDPKRHIKIPLKSSTSGAQAVRSVYIGPNVTSETEANVRAFLSAEGYTCPLIKVTGR